jgi:hypothetical protein
MDWGEKLGRRLSFLGSEATEEEEEKKKRWRHYLFLQETETSEAQTIATLYSITLDHITHEEKLSKYRFRLKLSISGIQVNSYRKQLPFLLNSVSGFKKSTTK